MTADEKERNYTTVNIQKGLMSKVDFVVNSEKCGYQNRSDFILEAIRKRLRELGILE